MKTLSGLGVLLIGTVSCTQLAENGYRITGTVADTIYNGQMMYLETSERDSILDSVLVENNQFLFEGTIDTAQLCIIHNKIAKLGDIIAEPGDIKMEIAEKSITLSGSPLNEALTQIVTWQDSIEQAFETMQNELSNINANQADAMQKIRGFYEENKPAWMAKTKDLFLAHTNDVVGCYLINKSLFFQEFSLDEKWEILQQLGDCVKNSRVAQHYIQQTEGEINTQVGKPYADIKGTNEKGEEVALSDFVGKGNYVLVDVWASWCGPCKMEIPNIAKLHNQFKDKGLTVVGVFTWDEMKNLPKAMEEEGITWNQIVDSNKMAGTQYGIMGIPFIFLISPEGTIVERGLRGEDMIKRVEEYLSK